MLAPYQKKSNNRPKRPTTVGSTRSRSSSGNQAILNSMHNTTSPRKIMQYVGVSECPICRTLCETYAASLVAEKTQISPFDRLVAQDFIPARELAGGTKFCRFHTYWKKRYDVLSFINKGLRENIRYEALYDLLAVMDTQAKASIEWLLEDIKEEVEGKQVSTRGEVRNSLIREARRLTDLWDAQVEDLDTQIAYSIGDLQTRQAQDLAFEFENLERQYGGKKPHYSSALLELFQQEPRMKRAGAFNEALKVVDAGKKLEQVQTMRFKREIEREKSLKLSWKVCQQTRQINGIVDKMQRHRRKEEANREIDRERLKSRVKTALQRLEKVQRQAVVVMRPPFLQHIYRVRHVVEVEAKKDHSSPRSSFKERPALYEGPQQVSFRTRDVDDFGRDVRTVDTFPECSSDFFYTMIMGLQNMNRIGMGGSAASNAPGEEGFNNSNASSPIRTRPVSSQSQNRNRSSSAPGNTLTRPKSAPLTGNSFFNSASKMGGIHCDWCGAFTTKPIELEQEKDMPASVQRALDSTEFANVALSAPSVDTIIPGPRGIPDVNNKKPKQTSMTELKKIIEPTASTTGDDGSLKSTKYVAKCCSFACMYNWNAKNSPTYLRSRRHLQIDLMQRTAKKEQLDRLPQVQTDAGMKFVRQG
ncbi:unnamed protein product [Amoebophrya sp. A120]|nr:unnamed protein product [Amoebophrya sp. A120]|eukprot:GSA120T00016178001.1